MMQIINLRLIAGGACFALLLCGCISVSSSPTPRFYKLQAVSLNHPGQTSHMPSDVLIGVGPVKIPEYQDRPQIVTIDKNKMLNFAQFDRWGESLDLGVARLLRENLTGILEGTPITSYPWNQSLAVKYQVIVEVVQLDAQLDHDLFMVVQWQIMDVLTLKTLIIKRAEFRQPVILRSYTGLAGALSAACASLSSEIAEALAALDNPSKHEK